MAYQSYNDYLINHSYVRSSYSNNPYANNQYQNNQYMSNQYNNGYGFQSKAQQFEDWTVNVDLGEADPEENFKMVRDGKVRPKEYKEDVKQLASEYISMYDTDGDGKISYEEFENYNVQELYDNVFSVSKKELKALKKDLKRIYKRLNVDNKKDSKDNLDVREIMNYFYTMDANNDDVTVDGTITQDEYQDTTAMLADKSSIGKNFAKAMKTSFKNIFKNCN